jgi:phage FluMu protein Com
MTREVRVEDLPNELKVLLPETSMKVVVIGNKAYEMHPLKEKAVEKISQDIVDLLQSVGNRDARCEKCGKIWANAVSKGVLDCPECKEPLKSLAIHPIKAILSTGKIAEFVEAAIGVPKEEAREMTANQVRHFAGIFWEQNFSDAGLPKESRENFQKLLEMMGMGSLAGKMKLKTPESE